MFLPLSVMIKQNSSFKGILMRSFDPHWEQEHFSFMKRALRIKKYRMLELDTRIQDLGNNMNVWKRTKIFVSFLPGFQVGSLRKVKEKMQTLHV